MARVEVNLCIACGACQDACAFDAIRIEDHAQVDWQKCMGCGVCEGQCPQQAITLVRDERKGVPLDVAQMVEPGNITAN
jgi:ferredoxin